MAGQATDWVKIWTDIEPLVYVIVGAIVGFIGPWLQQRSSMRHADKTRFHDLRVKVYAKYIETVNKIVLKFSEDRRDDDDLNEIRFLGAQVSLIASEDTRTHLVKINNIIGQMSENLASTRSYMGDYNQHTRDFIEAARKEIEP
jgi:hypothetical protein